MNWYNCLKFALKLAAKPYGYWVAPDGKATPVVEYQGHDGIARDIVTKAQGKLGNPEEIYVDPDGYQAVMMLKQNGYARIMTQSSAGQPPYVEIEKHQPTQQQINSICDIFDGYPEMDVIVPQGSFSLYPRAAREPLLFSKREKFVLPSERP